MLSLLERIDRRLRMLKEEHDDVSSWKGPEAIEHEWQAGEKGLQPGPAYHALRAIAGPATDNPVWAMNWTSPTGHTYHKGEPAPRWTEDEIHRAMHGQMRIWAQGAGREAFGKGHRGKVDPNWVMDLMNNGHAELQKMLSMETDEGRILGGGGFVSYIAGRVRDAMAKGVGGDNDTRRALGRVSELIDTNNPDKTDAIAAAVGMQYREHSSSISSKKDPGNIYGQYTPAVYQMAMKLGEALRSGDKAAVKQVKSELEDLRGDIRDSMALVQGTDTGRRAIAIPHDAKDNSEAQTHRDQLMRTKISSMDATLGPDSDATLGGTLYQDRRSDMRGGPDLSGMDSDVIYGALKTAIDTSSDNSPATQKYLEANGVQKINKGDFRYLIRLLSPWLPGGKYPYKGTAKDPEMDGGTPSQWVQNGQPHLMDRTDIMQSISQSSQGGGGGGSGLEHPIFDQVLPGSRPLSPMEREVLAYLVGLHPKSPGVPLSQGKIAKSWESIHEPGKIGINPIRISQVAAKIKEKTGKTIQQLLDEVQAGGGSAAQAGDADSIPSRDPLGKFQGWMKLYQEETDLDESRDPIDSEIISECVRAVDRLYYWAVVRPIIFG